MANKAEVPRLSPRMREQVREHAILQGENSVTAEVTAHLLAAV